MKLLENYKTKKGEVFSIFVKEKLEPKIGDYEGLYFKIIPSFNKEYSWSCEIKISGTLQAVWNIKESDLAVYEILKDLGVLKIKQTIEKGESFRDFMFHTYVSQKTIEDEKQKLIQELNSLREVSITEKGDKGKTLEKILSILNELKLNTLKISENLLKEDLRKKNHSQNFSDPKLEIFVEEIDSFKEVKKIHIDLIKNLVPLKWSEEQIQKWFESIICEPTHKKDWGGEENDLFTTRLIINGNRKNTAFLLKGPGVRKNELRISDCGKNGNQLVRLFESPAEIFIIQYVGEISEDVRKDAEGKTLSLRGKGKNAQFCIIDGFDTARILKAYNKI